jgi:hypothetical protein
MSENYSRLEPMFADYSESPEEILLYGDTEEFNRLSKKILINNAKIILQRREKTFNSVSIESILIKHRSLNVPVKLSVKNRKLLIEGGLEKLKILSDNLKTGEIELKNYHIHIEYHVDHFYLSPESIPLVVNYT